LGYSSLPNPNRNVFVNIIAMKAILERAFKAAIQAAQPEQVLLEHLPNPPKGRTVVVGAGKAASSMALAFDQAWLAECSGVVVTRYGHVTAQRPKRISVLEASHPLPDEAGVHATLEILKSLENLSSDDLVVCLISGGGSALMVAPDGISLLEKIALTEELLRSGADITEMNVVRKHLSLVKGGQLAIAAFPAFVCSLIVSDVVGDDLSSIASGLTVPDPSSFADALEVLDRYNILAPTARAHLEHGMKGQVLETPKPGDTRFEQVENRLIVTNAVSLEAAKQELIRAGFETRVLSDSITGEATDAALMHAEVARTLRSGQALLSGGETTVTIPSTNTGRGGRNLEFLLGFALHNPGCYAVAGDTDGIDGSSFAAGAFVTPDTLERADSLGLSASEFLEHHDAHGFFESLGDLLVTNPTGTNVNDFRLILKP
jgi:glycerate 2-kinase